MSESRPAAFGEVTSQLRRWGEGEPAAFDEVMPVVEAELRRLARRCLRVERRAHTLQPTALVNEAWLRLRDERAVQWCNRAHFFAVAARLMRFILVDYARKRLARKRGGDVFHTTLSEASDLAQASCAGLLEIDDALQRLENIDARKGRVATLRLYSEASLDEIAETLGVATVTVARDWRFARAWLHQQLKR